MVKEAKQKDIYDHLVVGDMIAAVTDVGDACDLMLAADVLTYVGDLAPIMNAVRAHLTADGLFAFTVQRHDGDGFVLGAEHRFSHNRAYLASVAAQNSFDMAHVHDAVSREEKGVDVPGLVVVLAAR